mgnify:CR=1 FL=1
MTDSRDWHAEQNTEQGVLFEVVLAGNGLTEPTSYQAHGLVKEGIGFPEGKIPEGTSAGESQITDAFHEAIRQEAVQRRRRQAQSGEHSPLQRDGTYQTVRVGDYLPGGFGPVTYRNLRQAQQYAASLDHKEESPNVQA